MIENPFTPLEEGAYTYFAIQSRRTHVSSWLKPDSYLQELTGEKWWTGIPSSGEYVAEPWTGKGNTHKPKYKSYEEKHQVWTKTGGVGWWKLKNAILAMRRLQKASSAGVLDYKSCYGSKVQAVRYEFRIVKITVSKKVETVIDNDLLNCCACGN